MKVAITGANGFLGKYLVDACLADGHQVYAFVRKSADTSSLKLNNNLKICTINYDNIDTELQKLKTQIGAFDFLIHNAGKTSSIDNEDYVNINTKMTGRLLDAISKVEFLDLGGKFVYISSYTAHGPVGVNHPVSKYGESKKAAEELIQKSGIAHVMFRPTAIYGAGDKAFLPLFQTANKGLYPLTRSSQKMSMIHAADLASIVARDMSSREGILHVSDGNTYSHAQFKKVLSEVIGRKIRNIRIPGIITKISLWISDIWYRITRGTPNLTLEKFEEISQDWELHDDESLEHADLQIAFDLKKGFKDAYDYYARKKLL